jgi:hypothetical protein
VRSEESARQKVNQANEKLLVAEASTKELELRVEVLQRERKALMSDNEKIRNQLAESQREFDGILILDTSLYY